MGERDPIVCSIKEMSKKLGVGSPSLRMLIRAKGINVKKIPLNCSDKTIRYIWPSPEEIGKTCTIVTCSKCNTKLLVNLLSYSKGVKCYNCQQSILISRKAKDAQLINQGYLKGSFVPDKWYLPQEIGKILNLDASILTGGLGHYPYTQKWDNQSKRYLRKGKDIIQWLETIVEIKICETCEYQWISLKNPLYAQKDCPKCLRSGIEPSVFDVFSESNSKEKYCSQCQCANLEDLCLSADGSKDIWLCKNCGYVWPQNISPSSAKLFYTYCDGYEWVIEDYRKTFCLKNGTWKRNRQNG